MEYTSECNTKCFVFLLAYQYDHFFLNSRGHSNFSKSIKIMDLLNMQCHFKFNHYAVLTGQAVHELGTPLQ